MEQVLDILLAVLAFMAIIALTALLFWARKRRIENQPEPEPADQLIEVIQRLVEQDEDAAYEELAHLAKKRDAPPLVYFTLAALLRRRGMVERGVHVLRTILVRPSLPKEVGYKVRTALAGDLYRLGRIREADSVLEALPRKMRKNAELLELKKAASVHRGEWRTALNAGDDLAKAAGENGEATAAMYAKIGEDAAARGDHEAAHKSFQRALKLKPDSVRIRQGLARLYQEEGKSTKARRQLVAVLRSNPALAPILLPQIRATLGREGPNTNSRYADVLEELEEMPNVAMWVRLEQADHLYQANRIEECRDLIEAILRDHPTSLEAHEAYLNLLIELGEERRLYRAIERFIDLAAEEIRRFRCGQCGYLSSTPFLTCPHCEYVGALVYDH